MKFKPIMRKLSNGVTVILDPMEAATDAVRVCFQTGGQDEKPNEYGLTHFCEHMFCKGTKKFPTARDAKDFIANNGGITNASTSTTILSFDGRIVADKLSVFINFLADRIKNSVFDEKVLENERGPILDELRRGLSSIKRQQYNFKIAKLFNVFVPNGSIILGNSENIKSFTRKQMMDFISRRMAANNCLVCISGKIDDCEKTFKQIEKLFSFLPTRDIEPTPEWTYSPSVAHNYIESSKNVLVDIVFRDLYKPTSDNFYKNKCISAFEHFLQEKVYDVLRSENGLTYAVKTTYIGNRKIGVRGIHTETAPENIARAVALIAKIAYRVYTKDLPTVADLQKYKNARKLYRADFLEDNEDRCDTLIDWWHNYNALYDFNTMCKIQDKVTPADIKKYTRGYFDVDGMSIITQGANFDGNLKQIWLDNFNADKELNLNSLKKSRMVNASKKVKETTTNKTSANNNKYQGR